MKNETAHSHESYVWDFPDTHDQPLQRLISNYISNLFVNIVKQTGHRCIQSLFTLHGYPSNSLVAISNAYSVQLIFKSLQNRKTHECNFLIPIARSLSIVRHTSIFIELVDYVVTLQLKSQKEKKSSSFLKR